MRKYYWFSFIASLLLLILSPVWAKIEKIPTPVGAEYRTDTIKTDHKAINKSNEDYFSNSNFATSLGFQIQLDPFDKKQETIEMMVNVVRYWNEVKMVYDPIVKHPIVGSVRTHVLLFSYQKLEMQTGTGKTYELKKTGPLMRWPGDVDYSKDFEYFRMERADFEEILKGKKITLTYTVNDKKSLILTLDNTRELDELNKKVKADPYWAYCQPGREILPPLQKPVSLQEQSDLLTPLLGKKFKDPATQQALYQLGGVKPNSVMRSYAEFDYLDYDSRGLGFYLYDHKTLQAIEIYRNYVGSLPFGIKFDDHREKICQNLGPAIETNRTIWDIDKYRLIIIFDNDYPSRIDMRLLSYQPYKFPIQTPIDPEKQKLLPTDLGTLFGTNITDLALANYLNILGKAEIVRQNKEFFYRFPLSCTYITDQDKIITSIEFSREMVNGEYRYYPGILPHGLHWDDTLTDVERKLGKPSKISLDKGEPLKAVYELPSDILQIEYQQDPSNREIQVMRKMILKLKPIKPKTLVLYQEFPVNKIALSPDGKFFTSANNQWLMLWDTASGKLLARLADHFMEIVSVAYSPDGKTVASGAWDTMAKIWDVASGRLMLTLFGHSDKVSYVAYSPDSQTFATGSWDKTVKLWDPVSGKLLNTLTGPTKPIFNITFSPDGKIIAAGGEDKKIYLWDVAGGQLIKTLKGNDSAVMFLTFSPDGRSIASGGWDKTVRIWDVAQGKLQTTLKGHLDSVLTVAFSPDGKSIVSGGYKKDKSIKVWDAASGKLIATLIGHDGPVSTVAFIPNSNTIISGSWDKTIKFWDLPDGKK